MTTRLTEAEVDALGDLLTRAITNAQFLLQVASPLQQGDEDEFGDGDRHDGNACQSWRWGVDVVEQNDDDEIFHTVTMRVDDDSLRFLGGDA